MKHQDNYKAINRLETDFRAESVAAGLIESGIDPDKILIVRQKGDKRHVSKDVAEIKNVFSNQDLMEYLYIHTNRKGIYDALPENIFHQPFNYRKKKTQEDVIDEIRRHREEEFYARRYFQPFEMAIDQLLIDAQLYERRFDKKNFHSLLKDICAGYWPILKLLTLKQAVFFIKAIPVIHRATTDFDLIGRLMTAILDAPVRVRLGNLGQMEVGAPVEKNNRAWRLGVNSVLGSTFKDGYRDIELTLGPMSPKRVKQFQKGFIDNLVLEQLVSMMFPANMRKVIKYETRCSQSGFRLSGSTHHCYLGINTRLY